MIADRNIKKKLTLKVSIKLQQTLLIFCFHFQFSEKTWFVISNEWSAQLAVSESESELVDW